MTTITKLRLYLDTGVLLSLLMDEEAKGIKLGENVAKLLDQAAEGKYQLMVSEHTAAELMDAGVSREYIDQMLRPMLLLNGDDLLLTNENIVRGALKMARMYEIPFMLALHVVFAQRNNALMITRDITTKNFVRSLSGVMTPEDLIQIN